MKKTHKANTKDNKALVMIQTSEKVNFRIRNRITAINRNIS